MKYTIGNLKYDGNSMMGILLRQLKPKQLARVVDKRSETLCVTKRGNIVLFVEELDRNRIEPLTKEEARTWALENALDFDQLIAADSIPPEENGQDV